MRSSGFETLTYHCRRRGLDHAKSIHYTTSELATASSVVVWRKALITDHSATPASAHGLHFHNILHQVPRNDVKSQLQTVISHILLYSHLAPHSMYVYLYCSLAIPLSSIPPAYRQQHGNHNERRQEYADSLAHLFVAM